MVGEGGAGAVKEVASGHSATRRQGWGLKRPLEKQEFTRETGGLGRHSGQDRHGQRWRVSLTRVRSNARGSAWQQQGEGNWAHCERP